MSERIIKHSKIKKVWMSHLDNWHIVCVVMTITVGTIPSALSSYQGNLKYFRYFIFGNRLRKMRTCSTSSRIVNVTRQWIFIVILETVPPRRMLNFNFLYFSINLDQCWEMTNRCKVQKYFWNNSYSWSRSLLIHIFNIILWSQLFKYKIIKNEISLSRHGSVTIKLLCRWLTPMLLKFEERKMSC